MFKLNLERTVDILQLYGERMENGRDTEEGKSTLDKEHSWPVGLEATDSRACSENDSLAQGERTRAIVGELGKVRKGSDHKVPFIPHLGIGSACGRHDFIHTINGEVV